MTHETNVKHSLKVKFHNFGPIQFLLSLITVVVFASFLQPVHQRVPGDASFMWGSAVSWLALQFTVYSMYVQCVECVVCNVVCHVVYHEVCHVVCSNYCAFSYLLYKVYYVWSAVFDVVCSLQCLISSV